MPKTTNWIRNTTPNKADPKRILRILDTLH